MKAPSIFRVIKTGGGSGYLISQGESVTFLKKDEVVSLILGYENPEITALFRVSKGAHKDIIAALEEVDGPDIEWG